MEEKMPVYVKIDEYKEVLSLMDNLKDKLNEAKTLLADITALKNEEDTELSSWQAGIDNIEQKLAELNNTLLEPNQ